MLTSSLLRVGAERLSDYARDVTSQNGEDGMLAELLSRVGISGGWCVELGAWDGEHLSNTWSLWHENGWSAVLIEGDAERATALAASTADRDCVHVIEAFAHAGTDLSLDALLARVPIPDRFAVLSIDVDGDDFHLWADMNTYRAQIVLVEYNVTFPPEIEFVQDAGEYVGASARALVNLAEQKGYRLAGLTRANLVFVDRQLAPKSGDLESDLAALFDRSELPVVYSDFAGHHFLLRAGGWGYASVSRHGDTAMATLRAAATLALRQVRHRAGETQHRVARRVPALTAMVKALRRRTT